MTTNEPTQASAPTDHDALHEALEGIVDWADFAMKFPDVFNSHGVKLLTGPVFDDARELLASVASAPPDKSDAGAQWPKGCGKPNSCARHLACVYGCRVYSNRNKAELAAEIETVLTTLPAPTQAGELEIEQSLGDAAKEVQRLNALLTTASQREADLLKQLDHIRKLDTRAFANWQKEREASSQREAALQAEITRWQTRCFAAEAHMRDRDGDDTECMDQCQLTELRQREAALRGHLANMLREYDRNTCQHEETHRGGNLWTICDSCGSKWADDQGGFKPYVDPEPVAAARTVLTNTGERP
jgi:hypothetical protein